MRFVDLAEAAEFIPDGATLALGRLPPMSLVRALLRRGARNLDLVSAPTGGLAEDILIGAGAVRGIHTSGVDLAEHGLAPCFSRAAADGTLRVVDSSCPAMLLALQAGASGLSFSPAPGLLGSDLVGARPDWKVIEDPFGDGGQVVLVPALAPDYAAIHGLRADAAGNVVTTIEFDDRLLVQASRRVVATVEEMIEGATAALGADEQVIPAAYLDLVAVAPGGSAPIGCFGHYEEDREAIRAYVEATRDPAELRAWLDHLLA